MPSDTNINTSFVTGKAAQGRWSGVFASPPGSRSERLGQLFVVVSLSAPEGFDSKMAGDLLLENIQDTYYDDSRDTNVIKKLERMCLSAAKHLEYLLEREDKASEEGIDLSIEAIVIYNNFVYMSVLGEGGIFLSRNGSIINLSDGLKDLSGKGLIRSGSGKWDEDDKFMLLSPNALEELNETLLTRFIKSGSAEAFSKQKEDSLFGFLLVNLGEEDRKIANLGYSPGERDEQLYEEEKQEEEVEDELESYGEDLEVGQDEVIPEREEGGESEIVDIDESTEQADIGIHTQEGEKDFKSKIKDKLADKETYKVIGIKIKDFTVKVFKLAKKYIWEGLLGLGRGGTYLKGAGPKKSLRGIIILIILAACLLFLSIRGIKSHKEKSENTDEVEQVLAEVDEKLTNGRSLGEAGSIAEAVSTIEDALSQLEGVKEYGVLEEEISKKQEEARNILDEVQKVIIIGDAEIITDISGYIENATAWDITLSDSKIYISDPDSSSIYETSFNGGEVYKVIGSEAGLSRPASFVFDSEGNLMISDLDEGIVKYILSENRVEKIAGLSASSVGEVQDVDNYVTPDPGSTDILYLLRPNDNDVRKITRYSSAYSMPELRLFGDNFSGAKDVEIDGKIYVLTQSQGIIRYFGELDSYTITGLDKSIDQANCMELDDQLVFVGDSVNKRVVIITKGSYLMPGQGKYVAQVQYRGDPSAGSGQDGDYLGDVKEIVVDNEARLLYVLDGTRIFKVDLSKVDEYAEPLLQ
jgi:hypothetical protein